MAPAASSPQAQPSGGRPVDLPMEKRKPSKFGNLVSLLSFESTTKVRSDLVAKQQLFICPCAKQILKKCIEDMHLLKVFTLMFTCSIQHT